MAQPIVCNEPVAALKAMRSARLWRTLLQPGLPGTLLLARIQLNHGLTDESPIKFEARVLALYMAAIEKFAALHGAESRCFLMRAPESLELVGLHVEEFGGATLSLGCFETVLCVSPRTDKKVCIAHVDERFAPAEFDLAALSPKTRVLDWAAYAAEARGKSGGQGWSDAIKGAFAYYVNRHTGPTGQIELNIPGVNIVAGSILPPGYATHCGTTLTAAALAAIMAVTKEWGAMPLSEFSDWCLEAQVWSHARRCHIGPIVFGMPGELVHAYASPPRPKTRALAHGHNYILAHTGSADTGSASVGSFRAATTQIGMGLLQKRLGAYVASAKNARELLLNDQRVMDLLREIPRTITRDAALAAGLSEPFVADLKKRFAAHPSPENGYNVREKVLFVLAEIERAARAADALRGGDAARIAAFMNIGQSGEAAFHQRLSAGGRIEDTFPIHHASSDEELLSMAEHGDPLWRQSGCSAASNPETDLLADIALNVPGVLAARWSGAQRVAIVCKHENTKLLMDALTGAYYAPRNLLTAGFVTQVSPCRGVSLVED